MGYLERWHKTAATKLGLLLEQYEKLLGARVKCCRGCSPGRFLPAERFAVFELRRDGLTALCKDCKHLYDLERRASVGETKRELAHV